MSVSPERIKHLEFIQNTITRQASHSFAVKGWSLTVAAVIYAYAAAHLTWWMALVALLPAVAFAGLDAFYLRQERLFRALYRVVAVGLVLLGVALFQAAGTAELAQCIRNIF
ncbi:hypothetical protein [Kocuria sp. CNJ-770]|uniref:hypothetical protein n=1 Tax=Kocuria sp. CNJ-770 TaxID=1904964 RepID=UPI0016516A15|nr:hypothetical protein [Kocuria sp. CNJ-770]